MVLPGETKSPAGKTAGACPGLLEETDPAKSSAEATASALGASSELAGGSFPTAPGKHQMLPTQHNALGGCAVYGPIYGPTAHGGCALFGGRKPQRRPPGNSPGHINGTTVSRSWAVLPRLGVDRLPSTKSNSLPHHTVTSPSCMCAVQDMNKLPQDYPRGGTAGLGVC